MDLHYSELCGKDTRGYCDIYEHIKYRYFRNTTTRQLEFSIDNLKQCLILRILDARRYQIQDPGHVMVIQLYAVALTTLMSFLQEQEEYSLDNIFILSNIYLRDIQIETLFLMRNFPTLIFIDTLQTFLPQITRADFRDMYTTLTNRHISLRCLTRMLGFKSAIGTSANNQASNRKNEVIPIEPGEDELRRRLIEKSLEKLYNKRDTLLKTPETQRRNLSVEKDIESLTR